MTKPSTPHAENGRVIRASEVGAYLYCAHAWWLGPVKGRHPDNNQPLQAGWTTHERHGRQVVFGTLLTRFSYLLLLLAGLAGIGWLISVFTS